MSRTHTARAFARLAGVTPKTLRHYERRGLIAPRPSTPCARSARRSSRSGDRSIAPSTSFAKSSGRRPEIAAETAKAWSNRRHWPRGMREWAASLYDMDVASFEKLARFIDEARRPAQT